MPTIQPDALRKLAREIYCKVGTPEEVARVVSDYQVDTNLYGHDSHGCLAIPRFVSDVRQGKIIADATPEIVRDDGPTALTAAPTGTIDEPFRDATIEFSEAITTASFLLADVQITAPGGGNVSPTGISRIDAARFRVTFAAHQVALNEDQP